MCSYHSVFGRIEPNLFDINSYNMKRRILRKSNVLREGYMDGLRKAANEIGRILLTEDPMITSDMHQTYKTNSRKQSEWYRKRSDIEQIRL